MEQLTIFSKKLFALKFTRYFICGVIAFLCDTAVLNFIRFFLKIDFDLFSVIYFSKLISSIFGLIVSFGLNRKFAFNDGKSKASSQAYKFILTYIFGLVWANLLFSLNHYILSEIGFSDGLSTNGANVLGEGIKMFVNFFLYKFFVFK
jgi:putative flippase GtrA